METDTKIPQGGAGSCAAAGSAAWTDAKPRGGDRPPRAKKGWNHSEMVLVYYAADPEMDRISKWSIAYYHHSPPFDQKPHWVDFHSSRGAPDYWWPLPVPPNATPSATAEDAR